MYEKAFRGQIICLITYGEADDPQYNPLLRDNQICYSNFLTMMYDVKEEVQRAYEIMREGSKTIYTMETTPYSSCRVFFVDRFGIRWGIMAEQTER